MRKTPRVLDEHELTEAEMELIHPKAPEWLKRYKTSTMTEQTSTTVYQRTKKTDPKDPRRYKRLTTTIEKLTPHTVKVNKGALLRRNRVSFRSAADEEKAKKGDEANNAGTSSHEGSKSAWEREKAKAATKRASMAEEDLRRKKRRVLESSGDEMDEEDEIERAKERDKGDTTAEAIE